MPQRSTEAPLRIWALLGAHAGDNDQVTALVEALELPFEVKRLEYNRLRSLGPRLLGGSLISLTRSSRALIRGEPPPDLTISAGHRSVAVVQALRRRSGGRTRSIHVGFPRVSPARFDLVIATPQYPIPDHPNLLRIPYALTGAAIAAPEASGQDLDQLPQPRHLLVVGGPTLYWKLDEATLLTALQRMLAEAANEGGSVLVTTSPRTPATTVHALMRLLEGAVAPTLLTAPGGSPLYASLLAAADSIQVTADSVSMISDAIWSGKPLALVPIANSPLGRIALGTANLFDHRLYPQDLRLFWQSLAEIGIDERPSVPRTSTDGQMHAVLERVRATLSAMTSSRPSAEHLSVRSA